MGLNISKGNMYDFVTHTWNTIKGQCYHDCSYCYMKRWKNLKPARFDESELKTDLGSGNFIFVGSSCDMWANDIPDNWIAMTLDKCMEHQDNTYLFQTKNPEKFDCWFPVSKYLKTELCITLESNRFYPEIMHKSPKPFNRVLFFKDMLDIERYITIEPIMDFGLGAFVEMIRSVNPVQVNIGADSGNNHLPEPSWDKVLQLIERLEEFTTVKLKPNLARLKREADRE